ncbi:hypothetical protein [Phyllobacterium chamaecytisi]|uniref:hypothetical protein n=1 Tax=Phyllobacterium chamaecytisi TaxID=2876082 RepID=UPI001CCD79E4|nr:hypothetical protein [Phyllobacterium sp. KW56]MBZ9603230.1 hypothetical protein [Phyllobacterium sp. KW56]
MAESYSDYMNIRHPQYWMVIPTGATMPLGTTADAWTLVKTRPADHLSEGGRTLVDSEGYVIIRVNVTLEELCAL